MMMTFEPIHIDLEHSGDSGASWPTSVVGRTGLDGIPFQIGAQLNIEVRDGVMLLHGELDAVTSTLLEEEAHALIDQGERHLVLDLAELTFISASAMEMLCGIYRQLDSMGGWLELRRPRGTVSQVLHICGFTRFLSRGHDDGPLQQ